MNTRASPPRVHSGTGAPGDGTNGPRPLRLSDEPAEHELAGDPAAEAVPSAVDELAVSAVTTVITAVRAGAVRLADPPLFLAGRQELLAQLDARLADDDGPGPRTVVLAGPAGVGKTSLALTYAHRHKDEAEVAWQLAAEDPIVLAAGLGELAAQLGARDAMTARDSAAWVHEALAALPASWLLVFDNAPDRVSVQRFLPDAGHGRVLITTQSHDWPSGRCLEVPALGPDAAVGLLADRIGDPDLQAAHELARELGGLPLALEQAAAYLEATGDSLAGYLESFRQEQAILPDGAGPTDCWGVVGTTWALAFAQLEHSAPMATALLRLLAFCAPAPVPLRQLLRPRPREVTKGLQGYVATPLKRLLKDPRATTDAIAALRRYALIRLAAGEVVSVHPLVLAITADWMPADLAAAWREAAAAVVGAAIPAAPAQQDTWPEFAALVPHALSALAAQSPGIGRIAEYLGFSGSYQAASELWRRVARARALAFGAEHPDTLDASTRIADWAGKAGDATVARDQYAALVRVRDEAGGPGHPGTLGARASLAHWTGEAGDPAAARDQCAALLAVRDRVYGPDDPDTLSVRNHLARWTGEAGDSVAARDQYAALLAVREAVYGPDDPDTVSTRASLARWAKAVSDPAAARDQYAALLVVRDRVYGPDDPDTLSVRNHLARWTGEAGDPAAARDQYAALLPSYERVYGQRHPSTLSVHGHLAYWTGEAGDLTGACGHYTAVLPALERVLGSQHPDTLNARGNLACWTGEAGDAAAARDQYAALVPSYDTAYGPDHPDTLTMRGDLAYWTGAAGDAAAARDQYAALLPARTEVSGPEHPETLAARANLANWVGLAGDPVTARDQHIELLPDFERVRGPEHPATLAVRSNLANLTGLAGDPAGARDLCAALLPVIERVQGPEHPANQTVRDNLAYWTAPSQPKRLSGRR